MQTVNGMQMIYTRVEDDFSPTHQGGFQTYYRSPALLQDDVALIEQRVNCYQPVIVGTIRRQFFTLPSGNVVLTCSNGIEVNKKINDRCGARGMFLVHCLIFSPDEFIKTNHNPFKIFDQANFLTDAEQMVRDFSQANNREPTCCFEIDPFTPTEGGEEWWSSARSLVAYADQNRMMKSKGQSLLFYGQADEIDRALRAIFWVVPARLRLGCTFDTCIEGCSVKAGQYWAAGASALRGDPFISIRAADYQVGSLKEILPTEDFYLDWLQKTALQPGAEMFPKVLTFQELNEAFIYKEKPSKEVMVETYCEEFFTLYSSKVIQNLQSIFARNIDPGLSESFTAYLLELHIPKSQVLSIATSKNMSVHDLTLFVRKWMKTKAPDFSGIKNGEWRALKQFSKQAGDSLLQVWVAVLSSDEGMRRDVIQKISAEDYKEALDLVCRPISPALFFHLNYLDILIPYLAEIQPHIDDDDFLELCRLLVEKNSTQHLAKLTWKVSNLQNKALTDLEKLLKKEKFLPTALIEALRIRRGQLGSPVGLLGKITGKN